MKFSPCLGSKQDPKPLYWSGVLPTENLRRLVIRRLRALGWLYFVSFRDVRGYGLQASERAEWQKPGDAPSFQ